MKMKEAEKNIRAAAESGRKKEAGVSGRKKQAKKAVAAGGRRSSRRKRAGAQPQPLADSFQHAFDGILVGVTERNMKIHCLMAVLVVFFGLLLHISVTEWCICLALFGLVMGLELVNTAVESVVDLVTEEYHPMAKRAKDAAAGAVLTAAVMAAVTGLIIFIPRVLYLFRNLF